MWREIMKPPSWDFRKIDQDPLFSQIAPYYICQILYVQKKYDEVIEYAPSLMDTVSERVGEIAKIIGESYFMLGNTKRPSPTWKPISPIPKPIRSMTATSWHLLITATRSMKMPENFLSRSLTEIRKLRRAPTITWPIAT